MELPVSPGDDKRLAQSSRRKDWGELLGIITVLPRIGKLYCSLWSIQDGMFGIKPEFLPNTVEVELKC